MSVDNKVDDNWYFPRESVAQVEEGHTLAPKFDAD